MIVDPYIRDVLYKWIELLGDYLGKVPNALPLAEAARVRHTQESSNGHSRRHHLVNEEIPSVASARLDTPLETDSWKSSERKNLHRTTLLHSSIS